MSSCSETEFQGELQGPGSALLKYGVQAAEALIGHGRRTEERSARPDKGMWVGEIRMVEQVERIRSELQCDSFRYGELPSERQIHLRQSKTGNVVTPLRALLTSR